MSTFLLCDRCREPITQLEEGGWQVRGEKREGWYGHWGPLCPKEYAGVAELHYIARWNAKLNEPSPELPESGSAAQPMGELQSSDSLSLEESGALFPNSP